MQTNELAVSKDVVLGRAPAPVRPAWNRGKVAKRCNKYPTVWAAMYGCKGEHTTAWRYTVGAFGHRVAEYACPTCQAAEALTAAMSHVERIAHLNALQEANDVTDYRYQKSTRVNGVPTLVR